MNGNPFGPLYDAWGHEVGPLFDLHGSPVLDGTGSLLGAAPSRAGSGSRTPRLDRLRAEVRAAKRLPRATATRPPRGSTPPPPDPTPSPPPARRALGWARLDTDRLAGPACPDPALTLHLWRQGQT